MGICAAKTDATSTEKEKMVSQAISKEMAKDDTRDREVTKLLFIGPGESGKSTLFKQMISIYGKGFSEEDRKKYIPLIHIHVLNSIKTLCKQIEVLIGEGIMTKKLDDSNIKAKDHVEGLKDIEKPIDEESAAYIRDLWADPAIQEVYVHKTHYYITDSAGYFLDQVVHLAKADYIPSEQDIFRCRTRSTAILEEEFKIAGSKFKMMDVGGQRNERKKWIHCFQEVTGLLFVVALSEYDMVLFEDAKVNRMEEALNVFEEVVNNQYMSNTPVMLFLNKRDLFAEKIKKVPLKVAFPDYDGGNDYESTTQYIQSQFESRNKNSKRTMYTHITCATDPDNVKFVFSSVKDILIRGALVEGGLAIEK